jgi:hypothetical protein
MLDGASCKRCGGRAWEYVHAIAGNDADGNPLVEYQCRGCLRCVGSSMEKIQDSSVEL